MKRSETSKPGGLAGFAAQLPAATRSTTPELRPTGDELREQIEVLLEEMSGDDLDDLKVQEAGARIAVAWRVSRAIAAAQGHISFDDGLEAVPEAAWSSHTASYVQGQPEGPSWLRAIAEAKVGLVPTEETAGGYGDVLWEVAGRLDICRTLDGRLGLYSLLDSLQANSPATWPTPEETVTMEDALVLHALRMATQSPADEDDDSETASVAKAERALREDYALTEPEVQSVMALAHVRALVLLPSGEGARAMQYASLEDGVRRSQAAMDLRSELSFRKLQAMVLGLTRSEPENQAAEFLAVVRRVSQRQDYEQLDALAIKALPAARSTENVQPVVLEREPDDDLDDEDAMAEFDRENPTQ